MIIFLIILLAFAILLEGTVTTLPLVLICLISFTVMKRDTSVFLPAFIAGLLLDIFHVQQAGTSSIFYICFLFLILLYKKKYEIYSTPFVLMATFFGAFLFLLLTKAESILLQSVISAILAVLLFTVLRVFTDAKVKKQNTKFLTV